MESTKEEFEERVKEAIGDFYIKHNFIQKDMIYNASRFGNASVIFQSTDFNIQ